MNTANIVLFESADGAVTLPVELDASHNEVWLTQSQMAILFDTSKQNISLHLSNCFKEGELEADSVVKESLTTALDGKRYKTKSYSLDAIISVGYRVKSQRGVEFRRWATDVLHRYIVEGYARNDARLRQLRQTVEVIGGRVVPDKVRFSLVTRDDSGDTYDMIIHENGREPAELAARIPYRAEVSFATDDFGF